MNAELILPTKLPSYAIKDFFKDSYGPQELTMPVSSVPQNIDRISYENQMRSIQNVYKTFEFLWELVSKENPRLFTGLPLDLQKAESFWRQYRRQGLGLPKPKSAVIRIDTVGGKIVDINNKAAGLGLTLAANLNWDYAQVWRSDMDPLQPTYQSLIPERFDKVVVVTEKRYPFSSDQLKLAELAEAKTNQKWDVIYPEEQPQPPLTREAAILSFSYLSSVNISRDWRKLLIENPDNFLVNPLAAVFWDNKALMALPFLETKIDSLKTQLEELTRAFPRTYLFKIDTFRKKILMATKLTTRGLEFQEATKGNVPIIKEAYLKPLGSSGSKGVVVKKFGDWGGAMDGLKKYGMTYPQGFIAQEKIEPLKEAEYFIKDGYFVTTISDDAEFIALERMGMTEKNDKIHGGSKTSLIPVAFSKVQTD